MSGTVEGSLNYYDNQMGCGTAADKAIAARLGGHSGESQTVASCMLFIFIATSLVYMYNHNMYVFNISVVHMLISSIYFMEILSNNLLIRNEVNSSRLQHS